MKTAVDFEKSMRNVNSIAGLPQKQLTALSHQVTAMAGPLAQSPQTLSEGLYDLVSSGFDAKESMTVLHASAKAATAGLTTTEVSTKAVAAALNAYHRPASEAGAISDDLFETVNRGVVSFEELAGAIGYVLPAASTLGITSKEVGAGISTLTKEGQSGETAITNLNQALTAFVKPSRAMNEAVDELGFKNAETMLHTEHLQGSLEDLYKVAGGSKERLGEYFGNVRAMRAVFGLTGDSAKTAKSDLKAFADDTGSTAKVFKEQSHSVAFQFARLKSEAEVLGIELGHQLFPLIRSAGKDLAGFVKGFTELPDGVQKTIVKLGLFAVAAGPVIRLVGGLTSGVGALFRVAGGVAEVGKGLGGFASMFGTALKSGQGLAGSFTIAGESAAPALMKGLKTGLPVAAAAAGIGSIVYSAAKGDWKQAGFKAGGALIGGIAGAFLGPEAAMLGVGLGSLAGGLLGGLFSEGKKLHPLQEKLASSAKSMAEAFRAAKDAAHGLSQTEGNVRNAHKRTENATSEARRAQEHLDDVRRHSGANSVPAIKAERDLAKAKRGVVDATHAEERAERQHGVELKATKELERLAILETRHRINVLRQQVGSLGEQRQAMRESGASVQELRPINEKYLQALGKLREAHKKESETLQEAAKVGGQKWARFLRDGSQEALDMGRNVKHSLQEISDPLRGSIFQAGKLGTSFKTNFGTAKGDVGSWAQATKGRAGEVTGTLNSALTALGVQSVQFGPPAPGKKTGGPLAGVVPGTSTGDRHVLSLNGMPIARVESREGIFVGNRNLMGALEVANREVPRFQKGGSPLGAEPHIAGTQPLRGAGQSAIHQIYKAATKYYDAHAEPPRILRALHAMESQAAKGYPYVYGGGHGSFGGPFDCSGYVSYGLHEAGFIDTPMSVQVGSGLYTLGAPGPGKFLTWGVRGSSGENAHTMMSIKKPGTAGWGFFESGGSGGGAHEDQGWDGSFQYRHMPGFQRGGKIPKRAQEAVAKYGQDAFDPKSKHFVGWGFQRGGLLGFQKGGQVVTGKVSYFGGGTEASGMNTSQPGIAVNLNPGSESGWNNSTTQGWMDQARSGHPVYAAVTIAGKSAKLPITDLGPAGFTQRAIDVTEGGIKKLGFTSSNFPTDAVGKAVIGGTISGKAGETAAERRKKKKEELHKAEKEAAVGPGSPILASPLKSTPLSKSAKGLSKPIREQLKAPGLTYAGKVGVSELALAQTEASTTRAQTKSEHLREEGQALEEKGDRSGAEAKFAEASQVERPAKKHERAVLAFQQELFEKRRKQLKQSLAQIEKQLRVVRDPGKQKKLLGQAQHLREELGTVQGQVEAVRTTRTGLSEKPPGLELSELEAGEDGPTPEQEAIEKQTEAIEKAAEEQRQREEEEKQVEEEHTAALHELTKSLEEQTKLGQSVLATTGSTVVRALADILSNQLGAKTNYAANTAGNGTIGTI